jgi:hypothetical protein
MRGNSPILVNGHGFPRLAVGRLSPEGSSNCIVFQHHLFRPRRAKREQRNDRMSSGSLNHVQNVHLETLAKSSADGIESRGTY